MRWQLSDARFPSFVERGDANINNSSRHARRCMSELRVDSVSQAVLLLQPLLQRHAQASRGRRVQRGEVRVRRAAAATAAAAVHCAAMQPKLHRQHSCHASRYGVHRLRVRAPAVCSCRRAMPPHRWQVADSASDRTWLSTRRCAFLANTRLRGAGRVAYVRLTMHRCQKATTQVSKCVLERKEYYDHRDMPPLPLAVKGIYVPQLGITVVDKSTEEMRLASLAIFNDIHKDNQYRCRLTRKSALTALCMYDKDDVEEAQKHPGQYPNIDLLFRIYNQGLELEFQVEDWALPAEGGSKDAKL